jgi:predicted nucleic acid-binding protein
MYFLGHLTGWSGQEALWNLLSQKALFVHTPNLITTERIRTLMQKYKDTPMDLADASLVTLAEETGLSRIFTLDSDFYIYRINGKDNFDVIP